MGKLTERLNKTSLQSRFLFNVLTPPFLALLVISVAGFWLLNNTVRTNAVSELTRASQTTAAKVERELAIRETVLKTTATEIFNIKTDYKGRRDTLDSQYRKCKKHVRTNVNFLSAPNNSCDPFLEQFARDTSNLPAAVDKGYKQKSEELNSQEQSNIGDRLSAYVEFFPETVGLYVSNKDGKVVSSSKSPEFDIDAQSIEDIVLATSEAAVEGIRLKEATREVVFSYPINQGVATAIYVFDHESFIRPSWRQTPIDGSKAYALVVNSDSTLTYPQTGSKGLYEPIINADGQEVSYYDNEIDYIGVGSSAGKSDWKVVVGSPSAFVLEPVKNAQLAAVIIIGLLLVTFLWVGAIFVKNTVSSILILAGGALIFGSNKLDYRIELTRKNDKEFNQLAETMNNMAARIQEAEKEIDRKNKEFINIATHELKAPMTAIIGNLSMTLDDGVGYMDDNARKLTASAYKGTIRLRSLVSDLLDIARLESGTAKFNIEPLDIVSQTEEMISVQQTPAQQKQIAITHRKPTAHIPLVKADKTKLQIILTNFISNAIKYNRSPGRIMIEHAYENGLVRTSVQDTGLGIPPEQQEKMFQKFFRVEADNRRGIEGTGLGMYVTKQFIEAMGGKVWFNSEPDRGTVFHFTLPIDHTPDPTPQAQAISRDTMNIADDRQPTRTTAGIQPRNTP